MLDAFTDAVADRSTVYTGDILFVEGHPILWDRQRA
jgi:hypothetical protein